MASNDHDQSFSVDSSEPFNGVVVCCTSIPPDRRTEVAQKVFELGGVHKYDLTPDVTHLIVGNYDTPKYRHVARERPDVLAMDVAWVEAVSALWKEAENIDFAGLEKAYRLKAFETCGVDGSTQDGSSTERESLLVSLTGFADARDDIAARIIENGGQHTGDLTRKCTHLVVNKPEGKKFAAAKSWNVRTVTLAWLDQSIERGMILEETKFDPLLPPEEQGVGAWTRKEIRRQSLGKRSRSATSNDVEKATRKLRKTASMKLSSQRNNMFGAILARSTSREYSFAAEHQPDESGPIQPPPKLRAPEPQPAPPQENTGPFSKCIFYIHGFTIQRTTLLSQAIVSLGGTVASSRAALTEERTSSFLMTRLIIVPQSSQPSDHPSITSDDVHIVTEFYIEKCMRSRSFLPPEDHVLGRPFPAFPISGFDALSICTTAFEGLELTQVARSVTQLGARYEERFSRSASVLVCKSLESMRKDKLQFALRAGVPIVSADWLWECISKGYNVPFEEFIFPELADKMPSRNSSTDEGQYGSKSGTRPVKRTHSEPMPVTARPGPSRPLGDTGVDPTAFNRNTPSQSTYAGFSKRHNFTEETAASFRSAASGTAKRGILAGESAMSFDFNTAQTNLPTTDKNSDKSSDAALTERSSASLNKSPSPAKSAVLQPSRTKSDLTADKPSKSPAGDENATEDEALHAAEEARRQAKAAERQSLTSKITTLLDSATGAASPLPGAPADPASAGAGSDHPRPRRRQIFGRAISNVSNTSSADRRATSLGPGAATDDDEEDEFTPQATQLEYFDPKAQGAKKALMSRMMGEGEPASSSAKSAAGATAGTVIGGRSLRKR